MPTRPSPRAARAAVARRLGLSLASLACLGIPLAAGGQDFPIALDARPVPLADGLAPGERIGRLRFLGMLELPTLEIGESTIASFLARGSADARDAQGPRRPGTAGNGLGPIGDTRLSQLSGLAWDDDDGILYAISDKGWLFHLRPEFDRDVLRGVQLVGAAPLRELGSDSPLKRKRADPEALEILRGRNGRPGDAELLIGFERLPRIMRFRPDGTALGEIALPAPLDNPRNYRSDNRMIEALCFDPQLGILVAPEVPLAGARDNEIRLYSLSGESWRYPLQPGHRITAMECLGNGEVLVLETDFGRLLAHSAIALRLARLAPNSQANASLKVETLAQLDTARGYAIDNFEGLARHRGMRFFLVTDNNDLFFQRTLLLYIELLPPAP